MTEKNNAKRVRKGRTLPLRTIFSLQIYKYFSYKTHYSPKTWQFKSKFTSDLRPFHPFFRDFPILYKTTKERMWHSFASIRVRTTC